MGRRATTDVGSHPGGRQGARLAAAVAALCLALGLGGCQTLSDLNPVNLYHGLEGGPIADARPPPPNADAPYPNLADVPDRPADPDALIRGQVANGLVADRAHAQYQASVTPLPPPSTAPISRGAAPPAKPDPDASSASLAAATAPPAKPVPKPAIDNGPASTGSAPAPRTAPTSPVTATPLVPPAAAGPMPDVPAAPPAPPNLPGVKQVTAPTPPPEPPPAPPPVTAPAGATPIAFASGSSALPPAAVPVLQAVAAHRGSASVAVTGFGEAASDTPATQVGAIPLAFARARTVAAQLEAAGVPVTAIRLDAEAVGTGAAVRILP